MQIQNLNFINYAFNPSFPLFWLNSIALTSWRLSYVKVKNFLPPTTLLSLSSLPHAKSLQENIMASFGRWVPQLSLPLHHVPLLAHTHGPFHLLPSALMAFTVSSPWLFPLTRVKYIQHHRVHSPWVIHFLGIWGTTRSALILSGVSFSLFLTVWP